MLTVTSFRVTMHIIMYSRRSHFGEALMNKIYRIKWKYKSILVQIDEDKIVRSIDQAIINTILPRLTKGKDNSPYIDRGIVLRRARKQSGKVF